MTHSDWITIATVSAYFTCGHGLLISSLASIRRTRAGTVILGHFYMGFLVIPPILPM